jgi:hypothetical protein
MRASGITFIRDTQNRKIGKSGITFIRNTQNTTTITKTMIVLGIMLREKTIRHY